MKLCPKCNKNKILSKFSKNKYRNDGLQRICKLCVNEIYQKRKEKKRIYNKFRNSLSEVKKQKEEWRSRYYSDPKNLNKLKISFQKYNSKPEVKIRKKIYSLKYNKEYNSKPEVKTKLKIYNKNYYLKSKNIENRKKYHNNKWATDYIYKLKKSLRISLWNSLEYNYKKSSALTLLGTDVENFKNYISNKFKPEMNWENWGKVWELDHIKPISSFNLKFKKEQEKCFYYLNFQPLFKTTIIAESFGYKNYIGNRNKSNK